MALARTRRLSDIPTGHDGKAYLMVDGRRYEAFLVSKMSINFETIPDEKRFLQERMTQHAARGGNITGSITYYNCTSALVKAIEDWKNGGADYPDITIQAYASVSGIGRQEILATGVILKNIGLVTLDDSGDTATTFDSDLTADDFQTIESYKV